MGIGRTASLKKINDAKLQNASSAGRRDITSGLGVYNGPWDFAAVRHLLKRTMFGAKKADIDALLAMNVDTAVDSLLNVSAAQLTPPGPVKNYNSSTLVPTDPDIAIPMGAEWAGINSTDGSIEFGRIYVSFLPWWIGQLHNQERNILEKMTLFWHNHFVTETEEVGGSNRVYNHHKLIRQNALGNFKSFTRSITLDNAMLVYLNGYLNTKTAPDENYARELMELFTVGKGRDNASPGYTEDDVKAAARVLTGWNINNTTHVSYFIPSRHDTANKTFSAYYNNRVIIGRTGPTAGDQELDDLLNMLFSHPDTAVNIVRKLYKFFVYYTIDNTTEANVIQPLAALFRASNYEIKPVLAKLFKSEHFFDVLNRGCLIKSPLDHLIGLMRESLVESQPQSSYITNYQHWRDLLLAGNSLQQYLGNPPNVAGWPAYYQAPQFHEIWIGTDTFPKRNQYSDILASGGYTRNGVKLAIDPVKFAKQFNNPSNPNSLVSDVAALILGLPLSVSSIQKIKTDIVLTGQSNDSYWTNAWNAFQANPNDTANGNIVRSRITALLQYMMKLAEYQLS